MKKIMLFLTLTLALALLVALSSLIGMSSPVVRAAPPDPTPEIPYLQDWAGSPHADAKAEAFTHWDTANPAVIPTTCAKCHSTPGYLDFLGADGSTPGKVDKEAPIGTVITCIACHNPMTITKTTVVMPSGIELTGLGAEARCMECHQGRASTIQVDDAISTTKVANVDTVSKDLSFINVHYFAAAATQYGTMAMGGYQYQGKSYDAKFAHVEGFNTCIGCHDMHTLQVKVDSCKTCHTGVKTVEDLKNVRMADSSVDYNGNGNVKEGLYYEVEGLQKMLYQAIQAYANEKAKTPIVYDVGTNPYFFVDTNKNGLADTAELTSTNRYNAWTPRLLKAAYNYQVSIKDPGAFAHNGKYVIELLYDSIDDLNAGLSKPVDLSKAHRISAGHFAGSELAFRDWDAEGVVPATCSRCHSAAGLPLFVRDNASISQPVSDGFECTTCHKDLTTFARLDVTQVKFPSGLTVDSGSSDTNLCMTCHQGRESTVSVNALVKGLADDTPSDKLRFLNVHYFAAGATRYGTEAKGAYEYDGKTYVGLFKHVPTASNCADCHDVHGLTVKVETCSKCHQGVTTEADLRTIRMSTTDYDGDGNVKEGIADDISTMQSALYAAMQDYAKTVVKTALVYDPNTYPYYFIDTNQNGKADPAETQAANGYKSWTPRLLRAAYNYQYVTKDPGAFAHNAKYIIQVLYDSLENLGQKVTVNMKGMTRP
jgi:hypothetical protein